MTRIKHVLIFFNLSLLLFSFDRIKTFFMFLLNISSDIITKTDELMWLFDYYLFFLIFILLTVFILLKWNSPSLNLKIKPINIVLIVFSLTIMFFPLIYGHHQTIDRNLIEVARLSPFSSVNYYVQKANGYQNLFSLKNTYLNEKRIYILSHELKKDSQLNAENQNSKFGFNNSEQNLAKPQIKKETFLLGTDEFGRDFLIQIIYGIRKSIIIAFFSLLISTLIGVTLGYFSGMNENIWGSLINRIAEAIFSIPSILFFIVIISLWGSSFIIYTFSLGLFGWITIFKITRNEISLIKKKPFFITSLRLGLSHSELILKEILIYISAPVLLSMVFLFVNFIIAEASLSFLGLSSDNYYTSLGTLIQRGNFYQTNSYWLVLCPSLALALIVLTLNHIKSFIRTKIDPRIR